MGSSQANRPAFHVTVENVGGISHSEIFLEPGVTVLTGRNATNRTSFLRAMMAVLGSDDAPLKADSDAGFIELTMEGETYARRLERTADGVRTDGNPYLDDPEVADLFAFLLESNEARRAVVRGEDLRNVIMQPVDTESINREIDRLEREKRRLDEQLEELEDLSERLPELETRRSSLDSRIEEVRSDLEAARDRLDTAESTPQTAATAGDEFEESMEKLRETRSELESVRFDLQTERESLDSLIENRDRLERELESTERPSRDPSTIRAELERLRERKQRLDSVVTQLQDVIQYNEEMLDGTADEIVSALREDEPAEAVTDQLLDGDGIVCWTCGSEVERDRIEDTLERLRDLRQEKVAERRSVRDDIDEYKRELDTYEQKRQKHERLEQQLADTREEITQREQTIESLEEQRDTLTERIETLEREVEQFESETYTDLLDHHEEVTRLELELDDLEADRRDFEAEIREIEDRLDEREDVAAERERVQEELTNQRTRIERIERTAVEQFNEHMADLLAHLGYQNIERIWIERIQREGGSGSRAFELHVARATESGSVYRDTVDHLSESEREITGLVFALAGYLTHEVYETVPFLLLDSLEAIDSERIATLVEYFSSFADNLVVALLPEDAAALDDEYARISDI